MSATAFRWQRTAIAMACALVLMVTFAEGRSVTQIIDATGDGLGNPLDRVQSIAVDVFGNVYVGGTSSHNVFRIEPDGTITQIIDASGDGAGQPLDAPVALAADDLANVYVAGAASDNVFKIAPSGAISTLISASGDGAGNVLTNPRGVGVDAAGNVFVVARMSHNVFRITPGGVVTQILDVSGDGAGNLFFDPFGGMALDGTGNLFASASGSGNVFKVEPSGAITRILGSSGDGMGNVLMLADQVAADIAGNVYVGGAGSDNVFKVTPGGVVTEIIDASGDGQGNPLVLPASVGVDDAGHVYVACSETDRVFRIAQDGEVLAILDPNVDGLHSIESARSMAVTSGGVVFVGGQHSDNAFRLEVLCDDAPRVGCREPTLLGRSKLVMKDAPDDHKDQLSWKWAKGAATDLADLGDPTSTTDHSMCVYGPSGGLLLEASAVAGGTCRGKACWMTKGTSGFRYVDNDSLPDGLRKVVLRAGAEGKAKVAAKARGENMMDPPLPAALPLTVQLQASNAECWEARFFSHGVIKNEDGKFVAKSGSPSGAFLD